MTHLVDLTAARAEALFSSDLSATSLPSRPTVQAAIRDAVRRHGGVRGCVDRVATEYGEHPETAAPRMRWARRVVELTYPGRGHRVPSPRGRAA